MNDISQLFVTHIYRHEFGSSHSFLSNLERACRCICEDDKAGKIWSSQHGYQGYTSYASLNDLTVRDPTFAEMEELINPHVKNYAKVCELDLGRKRLVLDSLWINILQPGGFHAAHIHPHSVISGTLYIVIPKGASALRFEDPRLGLMMSAPPRKTNSKKENSTFVSYQPKRGTLLLWESYLRHEVPLLKSRSERISVSFNYRWE
ncbi:MAG: TIGR02466 family protein [Hyphomicrobium sp.]